MQSYRIGKTLIEINLQDNHEKVRIYWKYLKAKLQKKKSEVVSDTTQLKQGFGDESLIIEGRWKK